MPIFGRNDLDAFELVDNLYMFNYHDIHINFAKQKLLARLPSISRFSSDFPELEDLGSNLNGKLYFVADKNNTYICSRRKQYTSPDAHRCSDIHLYTIIKKIPCTSKAFYNFNNEVFTKHPKLSNNITKDYKVYMKFLLGSECKMFLKHDKITKLIDNIIDPSNLSGKFYGYHKDHWIVENIHISFKYKQFIVADALLNLVAKNETEYALTITLDDKSVVIDNSSSLIIENNLTLADINNIKNILAYSEFEKKNHYKLAQELERNNYSLDDFLNIFQTIYRDRTISHYDSLYPMFYTIFSQYLG